MPHLALEDYERYARALRRKLGIEHQTQPDMITAVFKLQNVGLIGSYLRVPIGDMPDDEARYNSYERRLEIREDTFEAANASRPRARMTLGHEFGHIAFGHRGIRNRSTAGSRIEKIHLRTRTEETQATRFGPVFLAPAYLLDEAADITPEMIRERFNISAKSAEIRAQEILSLRRRASGDERKLPQFVKEYLEKAQQRGAVIRTRLD